MIFHRLGIIPRAVEAGENNMELILNILFNSISIQKPPELLISSGGFYYLRFHLRLDSFYLVMKLLHIFFVVGAVGRCDLGRTSLSPYDDVITGGV